jgi:diacylglycerol kinase (ATP)
MTLTPRPNSPQKISPARKGPLHVLDAARYSFAGFQRLIQESAARLEFLGAGLLVPLLIWRGAELWHWLVLAGLFALVLATEALNTAIEILVDRLSPEWSQMAKDAKDLGSFAVGMVILVALGFVGAVLLGLV